MFTMKIDQEHSEVLVMDGELVYMRFKFNEYNAQRIQEIAAQVTVCRNQHADLKNQSAVIIQEQKKIDKLEQQLLGHVAWLGKLHPTSSPCGGAPVVTPSGAHCDNCGEIWPENENGSLREWEHNA